MLDARLAVGFLEDDPVLLGHQHDAREVVRPEQWLEVGIDLLREPGLRRPSWLHEDGRQQKDGDPEQTSIH